MANANDDRERRRNERVKAVEELLRDVPTPAEPAERKSRWIVADKNEPDPRSVY